AWLENRLSSDRRGQRPLGLSLPLAVPHARHGYRSVGGVKNMKKIHILKRSIIALGTLAISSFSYAANDDPLLFKVMRDEVETGVGSNNTTSFEAEAWLGKDINKLWVKAEGEYQNSDDKEALAQALYSRAISAYWDVQAGVRAD